VERPTEPAGVSAGRRRASGIYGTIVTAAVIAAGGSSLTTLALEVTVLVTLVARELFGLLLLAPYSLRALACWRRSLVARARRRLTAGYWPKSSHLSSS